MTKLKGDKPKKMPWEKRSKDNKLGRTELSKIGFYNKSKWKQVRKYILDNEPLCRECLKNGKITPAVLVDHIKAVTPNSLQEELFGLKNLQPLCTACHYNKTRLDNSKKNQTNLDRGKNLMNDLESC